MENSVTPDAISTVLSNPFFDSSLDRPKIIVQVVDLKPTGNRYTFSATDGKMKVKAIFPATLTPDILSGKIQNLGLICLLVYTVNDIPSKSEKYLLVTKCEAVASTLESEVKTEDKDLTLKPKQEADESNEVKTEMSTDTMLKPKQEFVAKSASQIINEQRRNAAPAARMAMTRRVHPLMSLNPYQGNWTIKVRVTNKGVMRTYKNSRGEGCVFNVELTDEEVRQLSFQELS